MIRAVRSRATAWVRSARRKVSGSVTWYRHRVDSIPSWVIVLAVAAVVGALSAVAAVTGLARLENPSQKALEV
mgnify:CR=1 FL=1